MTEAIDAGAEVDDKAVSGFVADTQAIHIAGFWGQVQASKFLLENGAELGWTEVDVASALCDHAREGNIAALQKGAQ